MSQSSCLVAIADGSRDLDPGIACEISHFDSIYRDSRHPIYLLHTDFRQAENIGTPVNLQLLAPIERSSGRIFSGHSKDTLDEFFIEMRSFYRQLKSQ
jgi:hypothetical protein